MTALCHRSRTAVMTALSYCSRTTVMTALSHRSRTAVMTALSDRSRTAVMTALSHRSRPIIIFVAVPKHIFVLSLISIRNQKIHPTTVGRPTCHPDMGAPFRCYTKTTGMPFGPLKRVADFTVTRKWKWVFVNVCECESPLCAATYILNSCQDGEDAAVCCGNWLAVMTLRRSKCAAFEVLVTYRLIVTTW